MAKTIVELVNVGVFALMGIRRGRDRSSWKVSRLKIIIPQEELDCQKHPLEMWKFSESYLNATKRTALGYKIEQ